MLSGMFVRYYVDLAMPFAEAESRLLDDPGRWLPQLLEGAEERGNTLLADVGFGVGTERRIQKQVEMTISDAYRMPGKSVLPIAWSASGTARLFPSLEGDLELAGLGERRTQLSLSARYDPPLGVVGRAIDRALLHRVAEATVKDFVDRIVEAMGAPTHVVPSSRAPLGAAEEVPGRMSS
jgi:hypothetical protein